MENVTDDRKEEIFSNDDEQNLRDQLRESQIRNDALLNELEALQISYRDLQSRSVVMEDNLILLQQQKEEALKHNFDLVNSLEQTSSEKDALQSELRLLEVSTREHQDELMRQRDEELKGNLDLRNEVEVCREKISVLLEERSKRIQIFSRSMDFLLSVKECLMRIIERIGEQKPESVIEEGEEEEQIKEEADLDEESKGLLSEKMVVHKLTMSVESRLTEFEEMRKKEKRQLENSIVSLTEENRDINSLLRIALVEKESVERALNRLKGSGEQRRVAILQIAERGLQKVGFGFMMGASTGDSTDNSGPNTCNKSDSSECEEEVVSLASTVEKIMKNLRLEITELKRSLDESRSDSERLQSLTEKQAQEIAENKLYIQELEERESRLAQNVEELMMEITESEEEVSRWREACELEVEAGNNAIEERDREAANLREELEKTKASLELCNSKLKLKEDLATAAMTAQAAAERSLQLADSRAAGFRERIEELTRQLEEAENKRERSSRRKVRRICWPWRALKVNPSTRGRSVRRMIPEMEALLNHDI
ncbi:PREDICTED: uncharacterized protein At3g49055-like [Nelumbo nucifera]|uniref:Uncharacterized protein At3g49055-like n=1 Tax=Nelumbo nucifera TaxID=4432 RepID=A0A1U7ZTC7_NELNU|nr:PREDICTED: uncharacterized protein At3g49055-like [Nelumbo nucifera]